MSLILSMWNEQGIFLAADRRAYFPNLNKPTGENFIKIFTTSTGIGMGIFGEFDIYRDGDFRYNTIKELRDFCNFHDSETDIDVIVDKIGKHFNSLTSTLQVGIFVCGYKNGNKRIFTVATYDPYLQDLIEIFGERGAHFNSRNDLERSQIAQVLNKNIQSEFSRGYNEESIRNAIVNSFKEIETMRDASSDDLFAYIGGTPDIVLINELGIQWLTNNPIVSIEQAVQMISS